MPELRAEANDLMNRGCTLPGFTVFASPGPPLPAGGGSGHRRTQGLIGLHHHTNEESCPWDTFNDRAEQVNAACCYADPTICTAGVPTQCDAQCAVVFPTFFEECSETAATILDQMMEQFQALAAQCDQADPAPLIEVRHRLSLRSVATLPKTDAFECGAAAGHPRRDLLGRSGGGGS